jgi:diguanylate cyclase
MYPERVIEARSFADAAIATIQQYEIAATPDNYRLWYEYHAGYSSQLRRTIDVIISNNAAFDDRTLHDLYANFFSSVKEEQAVRETSVRVQQTLQDLIGLAEASRLDAQHFGATLSGVASTDFGRSIESLKELILNLVGETQRMAGRNEQAGLRLRESADKIEALERNLENAIRDATIDALTGVANRKSFEAEMRKLAGDAMNSGDELALLMIDVDHFKSVNDKWGHQTGDLVLRHVAQTVQQSVRGEDHVARYGGEEFAVILPRTDTDSAVLVGHNIRKALGRACLRMDGVPDTTLTTIPVTISIGVSCYEPGDPLSEWIGKSDAALYRAKREGRDCVRFC